MAAAIAASLAGAEAEQSRRDKGDDRTATEGSMHTDHMHPQMQRDTGARATDGVCDLKSRAHLSRLRRARSLARDTLSVAPTYLSMALLASLILGFASLMMDAVTCRSSKTEGSARVWLGALSLDT